MTTVETRTSQVAFFGRIADEFTREDLNPRRFDALLRNDARQALRKEDGYFVFADLAASPPDYEVELTGRQFQTRSLTVTAPNNAAMELALAGEDELQVIVTDIDSSRVSFAMMPFVPRIAEGARVLGEGGFSTTLAETLEGVDVDGGELQSVAGLAVGEVIRIVRSTRVLLRPGPYYPFPESTTVVAMRVVENTLDEPPVPGARIQITAANGAAVTSVVVSGVTLFRAELPTATPPTIPFMLGTEAALTTFTNSRGDAVFYYASTTPVTSLTLSASKAGYVTQTLMVPVHQAERAFDLIQLVRS